MSGDLARNEVKAYPKTQQLVRKERRYKRKVASPKQWQAIAAERQGPCVTCGAAGPNELHHILPRVRGGEDKARNIAPLCPDCHGVLTRRASPALARTFVEALDDEQYAYAVTEGGENVWESVYGLKYTRASAQFADRATKPDPSVPPSRADGQQPTSSTSCCAVAHKPGDVRGGES